jgi:hypothetical protein
MAMSEQQKKWLEHYSGQTVEQLISLEGEYRVDSLVVAFEEALAKKAEREGDASLTSEERTILAVEALEREVNNGGYGQFFINHSVAFVPDVVVALRNIGCIATARTTQEAIDALGVSELTPAIIEAALDREDEARDDKLEHCDEIYFEGNENIEGKLFAFIKSNRKAIRL